MTDKTLKELDDIIARLYSGDKFWQEFHGKQEVISKTMEDHKPARAKKAILTLILQDRERAVREARIDELKRLWNNTQPSTIPEGAEPVDMSAELHKRIIELKDKEK